MLKAIRRSLAATVAALASHQFARSAPPISESAEVMTDAECALREIQYDNVAGGAQSLVREAYRGPKTELNDAVIAANLLARTGIARRDASGRVLSVGGLWRNASIGGARQEFEEFVKTRMIEE